MKIIIFGGTGTVGHILTQYLLPFHDITIYSRNENLQWKMSRDFPQCRFVIGDIRDYDALSKACLGQDIVIHLAALKHVSICENNPEEAQKTNVLGTYNIKNVCIQHKEIQKALYFNTDKSINPINVYGRSKLRASEIWNDANRIRPIFSEIICGNIFNSSGSVIQIYLDMITSGYRELPVSSPDVERYFIMKNQVCEMVQAFLDLKYPERIITQPTRIRIADIVRALGCKPEYHGLDKTEKIKEDYICETDFATSKEIYALIKQECGEYEEYL